MRSDGLNIVLLLRSDLNMTSAQVVETPMQSELTTEARFRHWVTALDDRVAANPNFVEPLQPGTAVAITVQEVLAAAGDWESAGRFFANKLLLRIWDHSLSRWVFVARGRVSNKPSQCCLMVKFIRAQQCELPISEHGCGVGWLDLSCILALTTLLAFFP